MDPTDKCYLEYVEGYLTCTYNHKAGDECLMHQEEQELRNAYINPKLPDNQDNHESTNPRTPDGENHR